MKNYAHRGAASFPENTLKAFRAAFVVPTTGIECDVQATADGQLVVIHDSTVDRTTNGRGFVAQMSFEELQTLDAGQGEHIPLLGEVVVLCRDYQRSLNIEIKGSDEAHALRTVEALASFLKKQPSVASVLVSSFIAPALRLMKDLVPQVSTALLLGQLGGKGRLTNLAAPLDLFALNLAYLHILPEIVAEIHHMGLEINAWTVDNRAAMKRLNSWGVDGIITDYPEKLYLLHYQLAHLGMSKLPRAY